MTARKNHEGARAPSALRSLALGLLASQALWLAGCASAPSPVSSDADRQAALKRASVGPLLDVPGVAAATPQQPASAAVAGLPWQDVIQDEGLRQLVSLSLAYNRDLVQAQSNVTRAQALLTVSQADRWPTLSALFAANRAPNTATGQQATSLQLGVAVSAWELDLFGRVRDQVDVSRSQVRLSRAQEDATRASLVAAVAAGYFSYLADAEQCQLLERVAQGRLPALETARLRERQGLISKVDLGMVESQWSAARTQALQARRQVEQDLNALRMLVGEQLPQALLAANRLPGQDAVKVPMSSLDSQQLWQRPDVRQAVAQLDGAQAGLGQAKAAALPRFTLSAQAGGVSGTLQDLLQRPHLAWTLGVQALMPLFDQGRARAQVDAQQASVQAAVAQLDKSLQLGLREVADVLAVQHALEQVEPLVSQQVLAEDARYDLAQRKLAQGLLSEPDWRDVERSWLNARQTQLQWRAARLQQQVSLVKALGGFQR